MIPVQLVKYLEEAEPGRHVFKYADPIRDEVFIVNENKHGVRTYEIGGWEKYDCLQVLQAWSHLDPSLTDDVLSVEEEF